MKFFYFIGLFLFLTNLPAQFEKSLQDDLKDFKQEYATSQPVKTIQLDSIQIFDKDADGIEQLHGLEINTYFTHGTGKRLAQTHEAYTIAMAADTLWTMGSVWIGKQINFTKQFFEYDQANRLTQIVYAMKDESNESYQLTGKQAFFYNSANDLIEIKYYNGYDVASGNFIYAYNRIFTYQNGWLIASIHANQSKETFTYQNNVLTEMHHYYKSSPSDPWEEKGKIIYTHDGQNRSLTQQAFYRDNNMWKGNYSIVYTYQPNMLTAIRFDLIVQPQGSYVVQTDYKKVWQFDNQGNVIQATNYYRFIGLGHTQWSLQSAMQDTYTFDLTVTGAEIAKPYHKPLSYYPSVSRYNLLKEANTHQKKLYFYTTLSTNSLVDTNSFSVNIFPNPVKRMLQIQLTASGVYTLYNLQGQEVQSGRWLKLANTLDLSSIHSGIYFLSIQSGQKTHIRKIIKL